MPQGLMPYNQDYYKNGILFGLQQNVMTVRIRTINAIK